MAHDPSNSGQQVVPSLNRAREGRTEAVGSRPIRATDADQAAKCPDVLADPLP